jgi:uncharacterized protein (DUF1015 family)
VQIKPFRAWGACPDLARQVASVPYDVVDTAEAAALAAGNARSFLHVTRAEIDMPGGTDPYSDAVYTCGRTALEGLMRDGTLEQSAAPALFVYRQVMGTHSQRGIVATCSTVDYEQKVIKTHEKTRQDKEDDRTRHVNLLNAQTGPVFLVYRDTAELAAVLAQAEAQPPRFDFTAADGVRHTGWPIANIDAVVAAFGRVPAGYIADGHHRAASAVRVARERRAQNPQHTGRESYDWFLGVLFPASEVQILPYNRCVKDLNGLTGEALLKAAAARFTLRPAVSPRPASPGRISMYLTGAWHELSWSLPAGTPPEERLDVAVLQNRLLAPLLGIDDPRTSKRIDFIGGSRGVEELERRVGDGRAAVAFSMHPTTVEQMMDIADAGGIMPPKSTWFEPKLRDGLFVHTLE